MLARCFVQFGQHISLTFPLLSNFFFSPYIEFILLIAQGNVSLWLRFMPTYPGLSWQ